MSIMFVTGAAGFIGSNLVDRLLRDGHHVVGYDNFSTGFREYLAEAAKNPRFKLIQADMLDLPQLTAAMAGAGIVFHLAANADVRFGTEHPRKDLEQNTIATFNVLEAMRTNSVQRIGFSSTGSVYGEAEVFPTPENAPFPIQTSLYGASKVAGESMIAAYCEGFGMQACVFRFVSILGPRYSHGHVFDFYRQLRADPKQLKVLGNGKQRKSYLYVDDCVTAILTAMDKSKEKVGVYNLGTDEYCQVTDSIGWIVDELKVSPQLNFTGGERGWIGDNPFIFLDCGKIKSLGWRAGHSIESGVRNTLRWLIANPWALEKRA